MAEKRLPLGGAILAIGAVYGNRLWSLWESWIAIGHGNRLQVIWAYITLVVHAALNFAYWSSVFAGTYQDALLVRAFKLPDREPC